jgi:glycine C-acetyltransferase
MDIFNKCKTDQGYFGKLRAAGDNYFTMPVLDDKPGRVMEYGGEKKLMWSVNNYLGLADSEEIRKSALDTLQEWSVSAPMGSRMMSGNTSEHIELEQQLAEFAQKEASILFNYGYLGVLGTISSLAEQDDMIIMDKLAHASIVDGVLLSRAPFRVFKHNDMESLEIVLKRVNKERKGGVLIVIEGTYGMTGDLAKLKEICELKEKYDARLFIDDAHGFGVMGEHGRGAPDYFGVQDKVDIYFGTFAKSFASIGGFSAAPKDVIQWIRYNARTQVFAKSLPMVYVKSLQKGFELVKNGDDRRAHMWKISNALKDGLSDLGYYIGKGESPICAVFAPIGSEQVETVGARLVGYLRDEKNIFTTAVIYPVIPLGLLMFRIIPTAAHTEEDVETTVKAFKEMRDEMKLDLKMDEKDRKNVDKIYGIR